MFKSLFERPAEDAVDHDAEKSQLFLSLSRSVKKLHRLHADIGKDKPISNRQELAEVCGVLEQVFRHGLCSSWLNAEPSFWTMATKISHKDDLATIKQYVLLVNKLFDPPVSMLQLWSLAEIVRS
eukprot:m.131254 g.131254  ORF g.131254 m.131254 type:complete len:125 (+) comp15906_c1_seq3:173-547(+)